MIWSLFVESEELGLTNDSMLSFNRHVHGVYTGLTKATVAPLATIASRAKMYSMLFGQKMTTTSAF